jgi:hypothetical protein
MPKTPGKAYNPPRWRVWFPHVAVWLLSVVGILVILASRGS